MFLECNLRIVLTVCCLQAPSSMWTEDYQVVTLKEHFKAFDTLYKEGFLIGEMIWNFADFATPQGEVFYVYVLGSVC